MVATHLDDEVLAQWALDDIAPEAEAIEHYRTCPTCQAALEELREVRELVHDLPELEQPSPNVWAGIQAELDPRPPTEPIVARAHRPLVIGRRALALAASVVAIAGIGIGVLGTRLLDGNDTKDVASVSLEPLQGKSGAGTANVVQVGAHTELRVSASGLGAGLYEVWLINADGKRMVSVGFLNPQTGGTFQIPDGLTAQGYRIVDVSLEPDDGNPQHSQNSIIRGTLPT